LYREASDLNLGQVTLLFMGFCTVQFRSWKPTFRSPYCLHLQCWSLWSRRCVHWIVAYPQRFLMRNSRFCLDHKLSPWRWRQHGLWNFGFQPPTVGATTRKFRLLFLELRICHVPLCLRRAMPKQQHKIRQNRILPNTCPFTVHYRISCWHDDKQPKN